MAEHENTTPLPPDAPGGPPPEQGDEASPTYKDNWRRYRDLGLIPFPANTKGKKNPLVKWEEYKNKSPGDDAFKEWEDKYPGANIWVLLNDQIVVIDPDSEGAERFVQTLNLPPCPTSVSGGKSVHRYFRTSSPVEPLKISSPGPNGGGKIAIEVRTGPMGMMVPPSVHPETKKRYRWKEGCSPWELPFPELPPEAYERIKGLKGGPAPRGPEKKEEEWERLFREGAPEGERNDALARFAGRYLARGLSREEALPLLLDFNSRCRPPLAQREVETVLGSVARTRERARDDEADALRDELQRMNERYFVARIGGKTSVCWEEYDEELKRSMLQASSFEDLRKFEANPRFDAGNREVGIGTLWLQSPERRQYERIVLCPDGKAPSGCYNLWKGFSVGPRPGDWSLYEDHLRKVICQGDERHYSYLIRWMAHAVQHPERPAQVAVVLRGDRGCGKGQAIQPFGGLFGQHFLHITSPAHLVGHFNLHLRDCIFLFVDEALWAGDKRSEGVLKGLITEKLIQIEGKGKDVVSARNKLHIMMATNNAWAIPAGRMERRFFALDVSSDRVGDKGYFDRLHGQMTGGGEAALLHDLLRMDLSDFNILRAPETEALNEQKIHSMDAVTEYYFERLKDGAMPHYDSEGNIVYPDDEASWRHVKRNDYYADYTRKAGAAGAFHKGSQTSLGIALRKLLPKPYPKPSRCSESGRRIYYWEFPPLGQCRSYFEKVMKMTVDWDDVPEMSKEVEDEIRPYGEDCPF
jgi:Family of unknown function (DUF5906)/Bifunctional DNA primase/polymerase, N-terminal/Primase C terminal 1 (PriCT-1)